MLNVLLLRPQICFPNKSFSSGLHICGYVRKPVLLHVHSTTWSKICFPWKKGDLCYPDIYLLFLKHKILVFYPKEKSFKEFTI